MNTILRFLTVTTLTAGMAAALAGQVGVGPSFKGPVGLQLYSLRNQFAKDVPGTLDLVKSFGFKYVELAGTYNLPAEKYVGMLQARGFKPIAAHFGYDRYQTDPEGVAREAKGAGAEVCGLRVDPPGRTVHRAEVPGSDRGLQSCRESARQAQDQVLLPPARL